MVALYTAHKALQLLAVDIRKVWYNVAGRVAERSNAPHLKCGVGKHPP